jgi:hypothetical protein
VDPVTGSRHLRTSHNFTWTQKDQLENVEEFQVSMESWEQGTHYMLTVPTVQFKPVLWSLSRKEPKIWPEPGLVYQSFGSASGSAKIVNIE